MTPKTCLDCPSEVKTKKALRCRPCAYKALAADPEICERRRASVMKAFEDSAVRQRQIEGAKRSKLEKMAGDPAYRRQLRAAGRRLQKHPHTIAQEARDRAGQKIRERAIAWCPEAFRALNDELRRKGFRLAERKSAILSEIPGTAEHAARVVAQNALNMRLKHERDLAQRY